MPSVPESAVLLLGSQVQPPVDQFEYEGEGDQSRRTDRIRAKRVLVMGDSRLGGGMTYVSIPVADLDKVRLGVGLPVCWAVRFGAYSGNRGADTSVRFVAAADGNAAQTVHEFEQATTGSSEQGRRAS